MLYTHDVTCNLSRWNNEGNDIYGKGKWKLKHFEKLVFLNEFYLIFNLLSQCVFISVQNIGWSLPLRAVK